MYLLFIWLITRWGAALVVRERGLCQGSLFYLKYKTRYEKIIELHFLNRYMRRHETTF